VLFNLWSDLRYAVRSLSRSPGFTAAAIVTIALGIGVNAGVFTVMNGVLFRDLPAPDAHELAAISQTFEGVEGYSITGGGTFSTAEYAAYRDAQTLSGVLAHSNPATVTLGGDVPQLISGPMVSCNYFAVLRQPPAMGRAFTPQDCEPGADPVIVLGHDLWTSAFGSDPGVVGRAVELNRQLFTVVGVAGAGTYGGSGSSTGFFAPVAADPLLGPVPARYASGKHMWLYLIGRRSEQASLAAVRAELGVVAAQIDRLEPGRSTLVTVDRATAMAVPRALRWLAIGAVAVLMTAFGLILLIACANVANLLLARGTARSREIGIRLSLGASRGRVVRQLLTESMLISMAGGLLGALLAFWSVETLVALAVPALLPPWATTSFVWDLSPDVRVVAFATALVFGAGILFGLAPALQASKADLNSIIKQDSASAGSSRSAGRLRGTLVGVQVALCMTLMISAGLLLRGLYATHTIDPGFEYRDVAYAFLRLPNAAYDTAAATDIRRRFAEEVAALPGVNGVAYAMATPFGDENFTVRVRLPTEPEEQFRTARMNVVMPSYFSLLGLPLLTGRTFTDAEAASGPGAGTYPAIVSETTARNLWRDADPLGETLLYGDTALQVVGVVADAHVNVLGAIDPYYFYMAGPGGHQVLLVKSAVDFGTTAASIRSIMRGLDPAVVVDVLPLEANVGWQRDVSRTVSTIGAGLGALALLLAAVGIYGVVAYAVTRRYREIGIRIALGASASKVLGMILRQTMRPVLIGALIGVAAASAVSGALSSVMYGVSRADPVGLGGAVALVLGVALAAGVLAARSATRADPTSTLRHE
jgi:predicted permease